MSMFQNLSDRLNDVLGRLTGRGRLSEADVDAAMREIRIALLEADVDYKVVKRFVSAVRERSVGAEVGKSLTPGQAVVRIVLEELTSLMGSTESKLVLSQRIPAVIMLVGLQGSGKTTAAAKLANHLRKQGRSPLLVAADLRRPAAVEQLLTLGRELDIPVHPGAPGDDPVEVASAGIREAVARMRDTVIVDTAGRLHVDAEMMEEAARIKAAVRPDQVLMVVDAMTGQDAVRVAAAFAEKVDFDGVVITKLDGDARGGAALSVREVTGKPVKFASLGEKPDSLEPFHPGRMAKRILGMGDVVGLIEKAQEAADEQSAAAAEAALRGGELTLEDFLAQLKQLRKMGSLSDVLSMLPGAGKMRAIRDADIDERALDRTAAIIHSMTPAERRKPAIIDGSRRERIAAGAGVAVFEVNRLLKQFAEAKKMLKQMQKMQGKRGGGMRFPGLPR